MIDLRLFATVFATVFVAELGDKTQLAILLYSADSPGARASIFAGAAGALACTTAVAVAAGGVVSAWVSPQALRWVAGLGFVAVGLWVLLRP
jgi:putative Ca2+/H+ antiporter (TMEM165/GDT1 family)